MALTLNFLGNAPNDRRQDISVRHERRVAKALGGITTIGSGAKGMKGDAWAGNRDAGQRLTVECKATEKSSFVLKLDWLDKVAKECFEANREPALAICYRKGDDEHDFAAIPLDRWMELADAPAAPEPDMVILGRQTTLSHRWFTGLEIFAPMPAVLHFKGARRGTPKSWAVITLGAMATLYGAEAARLLDSPSHARG